MAVGAGENAISGKDAGGNESREAARVTAAMKKKAYESKEFSLANGVADYDFKAVQSAFVKNEKAHFVLIRTDRDISVKFNDAGNDAISIPALHSPFAFSALELTNIYFTNASGAAAALKVILV